ncbi:hypothetical protein NQ318_019609 [Aromia moschata]|uniref:Uncharacterized protein n=1 Tax=Aromia moschata TaxID=1265417 RepID=A0AAV8Z606_9CUCU|nr:hypothetical protein NQ318_019609 [Aromia moschata]
MKLKKLKNENRLLEDHVKSLESDIEKLTATIVKLKQNQDNLTKNISSLYLTAKAEIERKDRMIVELRDGLGQYIFPET